MRIFNDCTLEITVPSSQLTIGSDGFGFAPNSDGEYHKVPQIGNVVIEDNVDWC